ncbi:MAG: hypothetical protein P8N76_06170 [Pirellulaceae bacterium]|nr:hypothetical protein [Planctomycetaceae bacterium]MDG2381241.1 hypothetical protein [Pirellulaceae bacterium]
MIIAEQELRAATEKLSTELLQARRGQRLLVCCDATSDSAVLTAIQERVEEFGNPCEMLSLSEPDSLSTSANQIIQAVVTKSYHYLIELGKYSYD